MSELCSVCYRVSGGLTQACSELLRKSSINLMDLLYKVQTGVGYPDWYPAMHRLQLHKFLWSNCPSHAGVRGNKWVDITTSLQLGRAEMLRRLRNSLNILDRNIAAFFI